MYEHEAGFLTQASLDTDSFCNEISHMAAVVRFLAGVKLLQHYFFSFSLMGVTAPVPGFASSKKNLLAKSELFGSHERCISLPLCLGK